MGLSMKDLERLEEMDKIVAARDINGMPYHQQIAMLRTLHEISGTAANIECLLQKMLDMKTGWRDGD